MQEIKWYFAACAIVIPIVFIGNYWSSDIQPWMAAHHLFQQSCGC
jgi:hypothetical protein